MLELRGQTRLTGSTGELGWLRQLLQKFDEGLETPDLRQARAVLDREPIGRSASE